MVRSARRGGRSPRVRVGTAADGQPKRSHELKYAAAPSSCRTTYWPQRRVHRSPGRGTEQRVTTAPFLEHLPRQERGYDLRGGMSRCIARLCSRTNRGCGKAPVLHRKERRSHLVRSLNDDISQSFVALPLSAFPDRSGLTPRSSPTLYSSSQTSLGTLRSARISSQPHGDCVAPTGPGQEVAENSISEAATDRVPVVSGLAGTAIAPFRRMLAGTPGSPPSRPKAVAATSSERDRPRVGLRRIGSANDGMWATPSTVGRRIV